jgi:hypothetical protein
LTYFSGTPSHYGLGVSFYTNDCAKFPSKSNLQNYSIFTSRHCGRQLCHLSQPHHGPVYRVSGKSGVGNEWGVYRGLGRLQPCISLSLYLTMAEDSTGLSAGQQRVGVPEVRTLNGCFFTFVDLNLG